MINEQFSKYELARILGARALQISMGAPLLIKIDEDGLEKLKFDPIRIAEMELYSNVLPISVRRPLPEKKETELKKTKERVISDEKKEKVEHREEGEIAEEGEIMELAIPGDEVEEETTGEEEIE